MSRYSEATDRAGQWLIAQEDGGWNAADQAELDAWLAESDGNKAAYWRLKHSWREADRIVALGRGAEGHGAEWNDEMVEPRAHYTGVRWWVSASVAASLVFAVALGWTAWQPLPNSPQVAQAQYFETPVGGRKIVSLSDGSKVELNTASRVRAAVTEERREFWLDQGEAYFEVKHREDLPFVVHAGNRQVTVLGTKFSVRRIGDEVRVSVLEGRVRVDQLDDGRSVRSTTITGGDVALANGPSTLVTARSAERVEEALSWRGGMLSFEQDRLSDVAEEFNRYNRKRLVIADPDTGNIRIGGMFPANDPDAFVRLLRDAYGLKVEESAEAIKISG